MNRVGKIGLIRINKSAFSFRCLKTINEEAVRWAGHGTLVLRGEGSARQGQDRRKIQAGFAAPCLPLLT